METNLSPKNFFDLSNFTHREIFADCQYVWEVVPRIEKYILDLFGKGKIRANCGENVYLGEGTVIEPGAYIQGPAIIGKNCRIGHVAYLRENILTGDNCYIGHSVEVKNSIFLSDVRVPHLSYVGDSVLGNGVNLGAGALLANFRLDAGTIKIRVGEEIFDSKLVKFGAVIGDGGRLGVNSALNPGTLLGKNCSVYPLISAKGYHPAESIIR